MLCHNPPLLGLPDHALPVLNHDRTDHITKSMEHWCMATVAWSGTVWRIPYAGEYNHWRSPKYKSGQQGITYLPRDTNTLTAGLTGGNWQKWKRVFLACPIKFIGMKQLVSKVANILEKLRNLWKWEIWGNIVKIWYFVNNFLIEARIEKFFCTCVTHIMVIIWSTAHYVST